MSLGVILFFAVGTFAEMYLLTIVSTSISVINTLSLIMFTFLIGNIINRSWGKEYFDKMQWHLRSRSIPGDDVLNGSVMALSGMMLITPGVITSGLQITEQPAASAVDIFLAAKTIGKFHGTNAATTPTG